MENAVISVTFSSGTASKALDVTTPVSGTVTLGAVPGSYTFELKSVPSAYTMGSTTKIVQDCQDGKAMDGKTFTVTNNVVTAVATAASGSSGGSVDFNPVFSFDSVQNFALNIMEQNPEFKAYIISIIQESKSQDSQPSESENVSVPNLIGLSQNEAKTALANAGLLLGDVSFVPDGESFHVSEQSVSPGESIARNSTINLAIFTGHPAPTPLPAYPN
ncbi:PASTA domain-containing protein [Eubacterium aggregans]|uniref:PASTA domain-containing protein n=1 Tax=Eubacterium aggregans TaxID=81409 RepID=UPI0015A26204|nr:PASTA domain-containing protein [Eubacterium aggregans]